MLGFFSPLWLAGLATLVVPVALHFWSRRTGRAVRVGSIRLLTGAPPPMARRPRLHDPWLLALRCAMLAALILALAGPYWAPRQEAAPIWALVAQDVADRARLADSLARSGKTVRTLDPTDIWMSLAIADQVAPPGARFDVYAAPLLREARGMRPALRAPVTWHPRSVRVVSGAAPASARGRLVTVVADAARTDDARYIVAALRAAGLVSGIPAVVTMRAPAGVDTASLRSTDWIVWLSEQPLAPVARQKMLTGTTVLTDVGAAPAPVVSRVSFTPSGARTTVVRRSSAPDDGAPVWTDVTGFPLLTVSRVGLGLHYRFHSRFTPGWSALVLDPAFPEAIARLWIGPDSSRFARDDRPIAVSQVVPAHDPHLNTVAGVLGAHSLFLFVWLLALGLFLAERRIVARSATR